MEVWHIVAFCILLFLFLAANYILVKKMAREEVALLFTSHAGEGSLKIA